MANISFSSFGWAGLGIALYNATLIIYRLWFHPLAKFPGPKLAAATPWWECMYDLFVGQGGQYTNEVERMHEIYGPVVRVCPDEIHVKDPEWSHVLYAGPGHKRDKDPKLAHTAGTADGTFGSVSHQVHRRRRIPISSYFSTLSVRHLQGKIWERAGHLCDVLRKYHYDDGIVNGRAIFLGWSNDTLRTCAFGESMDLLDDPIKAMEFNRVFHAFGFCYPILKQCEWIIPMALNLPPSFFKYIYKPLVTLLTVHEEMISLATRAQDEHEKLQFDFKTYDTAGTTTTKKAEQNHHNLFHALLTSSLPKDEKQPKRMAHESFEILLAGSDTTARTMGVAVYHTLANPYIVQRLKEELKAVMPHPDSSMEVKVLENLPWLTSIVKESLRIGKITDHRLSLIATDEALQYQDWIFPAGTRNSMTPTRNSYDPAYFPDPTVFAPERWLQADEKAIVQMNHVFMPFAAGSRGCLGRHFAQAELQIGLARMFRGLELELWETERERDIDHTWAHISGEPNKWGKGLRFKVTGVCRD